METVKVPAEASFEVTTNSPITSNVPPLSHTIK